MERIGIERYVDTADGELIAQIQTAARPIYGLRVLHVNSTYHGGGVAAMLNCLVPLMNDVGVNADWNLLYGDPALFQVTKKLHNGLQGEPVELSKEERRAYLSVNEMFALYSPVIHHVVIVHDPQPLPMIRFRQRENPWVWRCHIDISSPHPEVEQMLRPYILRYDAAVVSSEGFKRPHLPLETHVMPPAIDPFTEVNRDMSDEEISSKLAMYGIPLDKPLLVQVSRFDKWKDPLGVLDLYCKIRAGCDCRLVLIGNMATDDPEGPEIFEKVRERARRLEDVHLITQTDPLLVNALQRRADVVLQLSLREGFGLTVSEALWKGTPVVATSVGGIPLQIIDGHTGYLVEPGNLDQAAERVVHLLGDATLREELGANGREHVRERFLMPRLLLDWLNVIRSLVS